MSPRAGRPGNLPAAGKPGTPLTQKYVVAVTDDVDERIAGHAGVAYRSPPQPWTAALALVALRVGSGALDHRDDRRCWTVAVPGGRRTVTVSASHEP